MDKSRQQFEEWFKKEYPLVESQPENTLLQSVKRQCHKAWQASRESLELSVKDATLYDDTFSCGFEEGVNAVSEVMKLNGITKGVSLE